MNTLAINQTNCINPIVISDIRIHNDAEGRYSLNDLHKAAGGERRHEPSNWIALQQTTELINEILNTGIPVFNPMVSKKGRYGGTYACKELVYSYAMWISAAFSLKVIRAYDALVTGMRAVKPKKTQPGKITADQQFAIKELVMSRGQALPKEKQAKAIITMWSSLKSHFGISYKEIDADQFNEAVSLVARLPLEGELITASEVGQTDEQISSEMLAAIMAAIRSQKQSYCYPLKPAYQEHIHCPEGVASLTERSCLMDLLTELQHNGNNVDAPTAELATLFCYVKGVRRALGDIATHSQYVLKQVNDF
ncbi:TPA: KilA-N domain-containing protein [Raoultella ornithinolytica]|uniref:KilA-N domain-containing protein n=1 Tax=Raoultella ornithinolytica TaxID=54291 RepID=UPI0027F45B93|nr:KilA-N domain-containing protein [Raoultella ornithinolytica]HEH6363781.1 KilA-N domain-containing protein [Raoultella planticola]HDT5909856.1 KilA-N domain-containing protein [Raoultella ornithinolytica]HDT5917599.1 KilA-N domain-containing protein [Raoultella ornithinolytica]HDT5965635.1 KilA-N domain-containing protein [Raoultella ornithinolytica]